MERAVAIRSIHEDFLEYIQQKVNVQFDNRLQRPICFRFNGQSLSVDEFVCRCGTCVGEPNNGFLVNVIGQGTYYLYYQLKQVERKFQVDFGFWVLGFRILEDEELMLWNREEREMLVNLPLKRVADFHGHICPDLVIGGKFCALVEGLCMEGEQKKNTISIIAENTTSALDAIQVLLGVTVGNQRLLVMDYGKHNYRVFCRHLGQGWRICLKPRRYGDEEIFHNLELKISENRAVLDDVVRFQQVMDERIHQLLSLDPVELFYIDEIGIDELPAETGGIFLECSDCSEPVLASRAVECNSKMYCVPCFQKRNPSCSHFGLQ